MLKALVASGHEIASLTVTNPNLWPKVVPSMDVAKEHSIPIRVIRKSELSSLGKSLSGETVLSVGFGYIFPKAFLASVGRCFNVHGTLLPKYRGARTLNWVVEHGEMESGVTVHIVDDGVDTGPILLQKAFALSPFDTGASLFRKTLEFEPEVVVEALAELESGSFRLVAQTPDHSSLPNRVPSDSELDVSLPLNELINKIRASDPDRYPAYFIYAGEKVCVRLWRPDKDDSEADMI